MTATVTSTPYYTLVDGKSCIGPIIETTHLGTDCEVIYGFSNKCQYDNFCIGKQSTLKPYPLTKVYLRNQVEKQDTGLRLLVTDAAGPDESRLHAATMMAVLEAHENHLPLVTASYRLILQPETTMYRLHKAFELSADEEETLSPSPDVIDTNTTRHEK